MARKVRALLSRLVNRLQEPSSEMKHLAVVAGQKDLVLKLNKWSTMLQIFVGAIECKENEELLSKVNVKMWLDDVKELADDVEEILDEISNQASGLKLMAQSQTTMGKKSSVKGLIPAFFTGSNTRPGTSFGDESLSSRIIDTSSRMEKLNTKRHLLGLRVIYRALYHSADLKTNPIFGREKDKKKIHEMVLRDEESDHTNFSIIPIIGTAGIGKTTFTRFVYDDEAVEDFKLRAWVSVHEDSNVFRISKAILELITSKSIILKDLDEVLVQLKEAIFGKKFLFVFDDVSTVNYHLWETLKSSFMAGAPGSKILVTTREVDIEFPVDLNIQPYTLGVLSDKACWSLFKMLAIRQSYGDLPFICKKVCDVCKGLPLAACILGGLISFKPDDEWECVLNTKIWDLTDDIEILPVLKLSYQHLPLWLQRYFVYCAILPDDYEFEEKDLVLLWIAEGLIEGAPEDEKLEYEHREDEQVIEQSSEDEQIEDRGGKFFHKQSKSSLFQHSSRHASKFRMLDLLKEKVQCISRQTEDERVGYQSLGRKVVLYRSWEDDQMEDRGSKVFQALLKRSLFQHSSSHASKFRMHDLVKRMARWISGQTGFRLDDVEHLTTFLPGLIRSDDTHYLTDPLLLDLLPKFKRLRALSLEKQNITELPSSVEGLRYLRYVNLSNTLIRRLPDSICSLLLLQILLLRDCSHLVELPSNLRNLINLRHLDITGFNLIREMPSGMKELKCLRALLNFIVGKGVGSDLKDLENLKYLRELYISELHNVTGSQDTKDSILRDKKGLKVLVLEWGSQLDDTRDELVEENALDMLQPHQNLKELAIKGYGGTRFPSWVGRGEIYFNIVVLKLENCEKCSLLPPLGCLSSLEHLTIKGMRGIKRIGSEIFGKKSSTPFRSLKTLCFEDLPEWEHWDPVGEDKRVHPFFYLGELSLVKCPKLSGELPERDQVTWLRKLTIQECGQLVVSSSLSVPRLCKVTVDGCKMLCGSQSSLQENEGLRECYAELEEGNY